MNTGGGAVTTSNWAATKTGPVHFWRTGEKAKVKGNCVIAAKASIVMSVLINGSQKPARSAALKPIDCVNT
jgi:hypothetical protein